VLRRSNITYTLLEAEINFNIYLLNYRAFTFLGEKYFLSWL
jgi:hypothetical protein